jgi:hypothetical protein
MLRWRGIPHCQACLDLAARMDAMGCDWCAEHLGEIVEDILPRAKAWLKINHPVMSFLGRATGLDDVVLRARISLEVKAAIEAARLAIESRKTGSGRPDIAAELAARAAGVDSVDADEFAMRDRLCGACPLRESCEVYQQRERPTAACPHGLWFPAVSQPIAGPITTRHLYMFLMPVSNNGVWQENIRQLAQRASLFNGRRILTVCVVKRPTKFSRNRRIESTDPVGAVLDESRRHGLEWTEVHEVVNSDSKRETNSFLDRIGSLESTSPTEAIFCCHGKGTTHSKESLCYEWMQVMYEVCLDDWASVERALTRHVFAGAFRRFGEFRTPGNHRWHFSGTFYWIRSAALFALNWRRIDNIWFGTESWPGLIIPAADSACLFADDAPDLYQPQTWEGRIRPLLTTWRLLHGDPADRD